jgi:hypothetical protein
MSFKGAKHRVFCYWSGQHDHLHFTKRHDDTLSAFPESCAQPMSVLKQDLLTRAAMCLAFASVGALVALF